MAKMTWTDAAETILKQVGGPLNYRELAVRVVKGKLVATRTKTPAIALHASIAQENKGRGDVNTPPRFVIDRGMVSLNATARSSLDAELTALARRAHEDTKQQLLVRLRGLDGDGFESYVELLLIKMGYKEVVLCGGPGDEGIDLFCEIAIGINHVKTAVQAKCKQAKNQIRPTTVRLLRDVLPKFHCSQGVIVTTSTFNKDAKRAATEEGRLPIILIDGDRLAELALQHEAGVNCTNAVRTYQLAEDAFSPSESAERGKKSPARARAPRTT